MPRDMLLSKLAKDKDFQRIKRRLETASDIKAIAECFAIATTFHKFADCGYTRVMFGTPSGQWQEWDTGPVGV